MAKTKISEFSSTPGNNTDIDGINIAEGCAPSGINDAIRELMAQLKDFQAGTAGDSFNGPVGTTTAAAGAFLTLSSTGNTTLGDAAGDVITINGATTFANVNPTLSAGTANGVAYLNGSKVLTTGSALTYNGSSTLTLTDANPRVTLSNNSTGTTLVDFGSGGGSFYVGADNSTGSAFSTSAYARVLWGVGNYPIVFAVNNTEQMRLTSKAFMVGYTSDAGFSGQYNAAFSGSVGIGTSSPTSALYVMAQSDTAGGAGITIGNSSTNRRWLTRFGTNTDLGYYLDFYDGSSWANRLALTYSGNLGLGVTPSAWGSTYRAFQVGLAGSLSSVSNDTQTHLSNNARFDGTNWLYIANSPASRYSLVDNTHRWFIAASGTAGGNLPGGTGTQAMTLDASGNLLFGTTSSFAGQSPTAQFYRDGGAVLWLQRGTDYGEVAYFKNYGGTTVGNISVNATTTSYNTSSDYRLKNIDGPLTGSGEFIDALKPKVGTWKADGSKFVGFLAHEVQEVSPQTVVGEKDAVDEEGKPIMQAMEYGSADFIANIIAELQSLRKRVAALEAK